MKVATIYAIAAFAAGSLAAAEPSRISHCGAPGMTCHQTKKVIADVSDALHSPDARIKNPIDLCGFPGNACHLARRSLGDVYDALEATSELVFERDPDSEAEARINSPLKGRISRCGVPEFSCKRDASPEAAPEPKRDSPLKSRITRCGFLGFSCKKVKRAVDLLTEEDPEYFKGECFASGGQCNAIVKAAGAFHSAVAEDQGPRNARRSAYAPLAAAQADCHGPDGDCAFVQRSLDDLKAALNKAVGEIAQLQ